MSSDPSTAQAICLRKRTRRMRYHIGAPKRYAFGKGVCDIASEQRSWGDIWVPTRDRRMADEMCQDLRAEISYRALRWRDKGWRVTETECLWSAHSESPETMHNQQTRKQGAKDVQASEMERGEGEGDKPYGRASLARCLMATIIPRDIPCSRDPSYTVALRFRNRSLSNFHHEDGLRTTATVESVLRAASTHGNGSILSGFPLRAGVCSIF